MTLRLPISLSLLLLFWQTACAQPAPADDFFNSGAQFYISNNIPQAKAAVETGLKLYPDDEKLKKLEKLLKQQSQQNQSQQQKSDSQKNQQQQKQQQNSQDQPKQDGQKKEQEKQPDQQKSSGEKNSEGQPAAPGQMTPEEAKRLLDAQKGDEQVLQLQPKGKPQDPNRPVKDW